MEQKKIAIIVASDGRAGRAEKFCRLNNQLIAKVGLEDSMRIYEVLVNEADFKAAGIPTVAEVNNMKYFSRILALRNLANSDGLENYDTIVILDDDIVICNPGYFYEMATNATGFAMSIAPYSYSSKYAIPYSKKYGAQFNTGVIVFNHPTDNLLLIDKCIAYHLQQLQSKTAEELNCYMIDEHLFSDFWYQQVLNSATDILPQFSPLEEEDLEELYAYDANAFVTDGISNLPKMFSWQLITRQLELKMWLPLLQNRIDAEMLNVNQLILYHAWKGIADSGKNYVRRDEFGRLAYDTDKPKVYTEDVFITNFINRNFEL